MCGRFTYRFTWRELHALLSLSPELSTQDWKARYNVAPTQQAPVVRTHQSGPLYTSMLTWGLQPAWASKPGPINARAETVATLPMFRSAFRTRRCIVPVSGFYEWQAGEEGEKRAKQPWLIYRADGAPLLLAGLWEQKDALTTFTIVTTAANDFMRTLHDRMPAILEPEAAPAWLASPDQALLAPAADGVLTAHKVSTRVNSPKNDDPSILEPVGDPLGNSPGDAGDPTLF